MIKIVFSQDIPTETIKNFHRRHNTVSSKCPVVRYQPTPIELDIRKTLGEFGIWSFYPRYPLMLIGDTPEQLLLWNLAEPIFPINYEFNCYLWSGLPHNKVKLAVDKLKRLEYIHYANILTL